MDDFSKAKPSQTLLIPPWNIETVARLGSKYTHTYTHRPFYFQENYMGISTNSVAAGFNSIEIILHLFLAMIDMCSLPSNNSHKILGFFNVFLECEYAVLKKIKKMCDNTCIQSCLKVHAGITCPDYEKF